MWQKKNESRINAVEMRYLRNMCGLSFKYRCRNSDARGRSALKEDVVTRAERVEITRDKPSYSPAVPRLATAKLAGCGPP
ncbi:hypothetical protein EVAR_17769_1 [Eumeta japonica]|uniref:Uncharacterized protein n=1 Tax=Eumeta variegata TaxID=151549 RepID=A0A4C1TTG8_EUMVA|nr:hypothetical protein EVAR_17769_1 [Eumeta japonica]